MILGSCSSALYAMQCTLLTLASAGDEVLLVDSVDDLFSLAARLTRTRTRRVPQDQVFDAIGEHTRALVLVDPDEDALELAAMELPLILLLSSPCPSVDASAPRVEIHRVDAGAVVHGEGLSPTVAAELGRWLAAEPKGLLR